MNRRLIFIPIIALVLIGSIFYLYKSNIKKLISSNQIKQIPTENNELKLISTKPDPLDNVTILPTQNLEFTFNIPIYRSEFKHHFDPEVPHDIEVVGGIDSEHGTTIRIKFRKSLELGSGYTLFVESGTKVNDKLRLDRDYIYHFTTISYRGV